VEAARDAGMYFSFPSLLSDEAQRGWALLLCPRVATFVPNRRTGSTDFQLLSSPYELSEVKFSITANAMSRIETAGKKERLATKLMVSEQLPETLGGSDELYALTPNLGILYRPVSAFDFFRFAPKESIQEGLLFSTEMENPVGHIRRDFYSQTLYIQKINEPAPIPVVAQGIRAVKDSGPCYVVLSQKTQWNEYDKKEPIGG
jgi:ribosomal protein L28